MKRPPVALIVAIGLNGVIGRQGQLPWRIAEDMKWFKDKTLGKPCIMGRKTWESLPKRPLPGRTNIIVTRERAYRAEGATVAHSLDEALDIAAREAPEEIMVIGGAELYALALPVTDRIYLTQVELQPEGDVLFPPFDGTDWVHKAVASNSPSPEHPIGYSFWVVERATKEASP